MTAPVADQLAALRQLSGHRWVQQAQLRGPAIAVLALTAVIAWQLSGLVWQLFPARADSAIEAVQVAAPDAAASGDVANIRAVDVSAAVAAHLFGVANADPAPEALSEQTLDVPDTNLPLVLRGTLAATSDTDALAIIADGRDEQVYRLRDTIRNGVTLHAVQQTQVILNRGGVLEALKLPQTEATAGSPQPRRQSRTRLTPAAPSVTDVLTSNASQFTQIISPRPYFVGGQQRGYRLYPGSDRKQFAALGLRPGDIVTEINGTPLNNPTQGAQIFSQLGDAQSITVTLERGGEQQTLTLDTSQLDIANQATQ